ncbi:unnamed protein product [Parnassius apollo]|uniref:(apollo) hypothetical protein n=1 Tax=Parnassius apollo TaxID=110799 RepID=A0A8S3X636_PARAO|nr:unnamed protein product [Parnassius apollo]
MKRKRLSTGVRLIQGRERQRQQLSSETPEHRDTRLNKQRERTQQCRANNLQAFENAINTICIHVCDICTKRCYPNQVRTVRYNAAALTYLPVELTSKISLLLCSRCQTYVTSNKTTAPPKAYWNNLDPGSISEVIQTLTQAEQRLLCKIIPFVKIVKFSGLYGQYGFRVQAVLFAQDIFKVSERLPSMLPRSASQVGIIVVTERLENLNITREFTICRVKVYSALRWLIRNNPLYKDVRIDDNAQISDQELVRLSVPELSEDEASERNENEIRNAFIPINNVARIIRASWHQGDYNVFTSRYAGVQCSAMALANIVRAAILSPNQWDVNILNANMLAGILTASNKSVSVFRGEDKYYFADYHSCGPKGKPTPENGKACVIECDNLQELCRICKRCLGSRNIAYTLTRVDVHLRENIITRQGVQVQQQEDAITHQDVQVQQPLSNLRSETIPIQTSVMLPIDSVQPDVEDELEVSENVNEIRRKTNNNIVNESL